MKLLPIQISVTGSNPFPIDMLRYDGCYPLSEGDANLIRSSLEEGLTKRTTIVLLKPNGYQHWTPNYKRWKSYGWEVVETIERKDL